MNKQYKQNQDLTYKSRIDLKATENNPKALPYLDRRTYTPIAGKPLIRAWYLLEYVIDTYPRICKQYGQTVELLKLSGCQSLIDDWLDCLIGEKTPASITLESIGNNNDLAKYTYKIDEFILQTFNSEGDQEDGPKVTIQSSPMLHAAIEYRNLANYYAFDPEKYLDLKVEDAMTSNKDTRIKRKLTQFFKKLALWDMSHKTTMIDDAEIWYKCRVRCGNEPGSIENYCNEVGPLKVDGIERSNVETTIAPYDEVTGYPRKWRK